MFTALSCYRRSQFEPSMRNSNKSKWFLLHLCCCNTLDVVRQLTSSTIRLIPLLDTFGSTPPTSSRDSYCAYNVTSSRVIRISCYPGLLTIGIMRTHRGRRKLIKINGHFSSCLRTFRYTGLVTRRLFSKTPWVRAWRIR
jgi:hypothetical protein